MSRFIHFFLGFFGFLSMISAQDNCSEAIDITGMSGLCETIDLSQVSFDVANGNCNNPSENANIWYKFTAEGKDLSITISSQLGQSTNINLIRFTTGACDPVKFVQDTCGQESLMLTGFLEVGQEYYLEINADNTNDTIEFCFNQPDETPAPPNDLACEAIHLFPNGNCVTGTTVYAENDIPALNCDEAVMNSVWYEFDLSEGDFFAAKVTINNISISGDVQVILGAFNHCDSTFSYYRKYCGAPEGVVIDYNQLEPGKKYYINVATLPEHQGAFDICVEEFETVSNSSPCTPKWITPNDSCETFDTYFSNFEYDINSCDFTNHIIWYAFNSGDDLKDIRFELDYIEGSESIFMGIGLFDGNWCENNFNFKDTYCGPVQGASIYLDSIENYRPYYVVIGSTYGFTGKYSLCSDADYNDPFINHSACLAYELDQVNYCVSGSNLYGKHSEEALCDFSPSKENWYKLEIDEVGQMIDIDLNTSSEKDIKIQLGYFEEGCRDDFSVLKNYCGPSGNELLNYTFPDTMEMAYVRVLTDTTTTIDFNLCINRQDYGYSCYKNDFCHDATDVGDLFLNMERCFTACTFGATQEPLNHEILGKYPTTWYTFKSSVAVDQIEITANSSSTLGVHFALFDACNEEVAIFESYDQIHDEIELHTKVNGNQTYYLAVTPIDPKGGKVDICIKGSINGFCNKKDKLYVTSTSMNSPRNGPYQLGETINMCYEVEEYLPMSESSCQWLQGIIPYFGDGWDPNSFDFLSEPKKVTDSLQSLSPDVSWTWLNDVHAAVESPNRYLLLRNADDQLDFCIGNDDTCTGTIVTPGLPYPPGWFAINNNTGMHPDTTYGDGVHCDKANGSWKVCFDVLVGENFNEELLVEITTLADGEIGDVETASKVCENDLPLRKMFYINCETNPVISKDTIKSCSDHQMVLGNDTDFSYKWVIKQNDKVYGIESGGGRSATFQFQNLSKKLQIVEMTLHEYQGNCLKNIRDIVIELYPQPDIPAIDPVTVCLFSQIGMNQIVDLNSHIIEDFTVEWKTPNVENTPTAIWKEETDENFEMFVQTTSGCVHTDQVKIHVEDVYVADVIKPFIVCKDDSVNMKSIIDLDANIFDEFTVDWFDDNIEDVPDAVTSFSETTDLYFKITGETGCTFSSNLEIMVPEVPINILGDSIYCSNEEISLTAGYDYDLPHNRFWITPTFDTINFSGLVLAPGTLNGGMHTFTFEIITEEQCNFKAEDTIHIDVKPQLSFNQDTSHLGICPYDSLLFASTVVPNYYDINWSLNGQSLDEGNDFYTNKSGQYIAQSGLSHCSTSDTFNLEIYPAVATNFTYDDRICTGDSTRIVPSKKDFFFSWSTGAKSSEIEVPGGQYDVVLTNEFDCFKKYDFEIVEQALPSPTFEYKEVLCEGDSTQIVADLDSLNYTWDNDMVGQIIEVPAGTYKVTFTDPLMCTDSAAIVIQEEYYPVVDISTSYVDSTLIIEGMHDDADSCYYVINDQVIEYGDSVAMNVQDNQLYTVALYCSNGDCFSVDTSSVFIPKIVYVENTSNQSMSLYPNPTRDVLYVQNEAKVQWSKLVIYDNKGVLRKDVLNDRYFNGKINLKGLPPGMYFVQIFLKNETITRKIIVH